MTSVNAVPAADGVHVAVLMGRLMEQIRATFAGEDWGGLRQSHFRLLWNVPAEGIRITDLARRLRMTKQAGGQFVTFLEGTGHVRTVRDPQDRRARVVLRTPRGDRTVAAVDARIRRIEREWAQRVGPQRYAQFRAVLAELGAGPG
ncbi:MAG TPA: MarR family transcriptional regulator [Pseudonocardia sp.]|jgi:DNA-binding MarR family transcriptional regulator|nr:MarR family transcriptional regulator [Pseudonocardia sp.]